MYVRVCSVGSRGHARPVWVRVILFVCVIVCDCVTVCVKCERACVMVMLFDCVWLCM